MVCSLSRGKSGSTRHGPLKGPPAHNENKILKSKDTRGGKKPGPKSVESLAQWPVVVNLHQGPLENCIQIIAPMVGYTGLPDFP